MLIINFPACYKTMVKIVCSMFDWFECNYIDLRSAFMLHEALRLYEYNLQYKQNQALQEI